MTLMAFPSETIQHEDRTHPSLSLGGLCLCGEGLCCPAMAVTVPGQEAGEGLGLLGYLSWPTAPWPQIVHLSAWWYGPTRVGCPRRPPSGELRWIHSKSGAPGREPVFDLDVSHPRLVQNSCRCCKVFIWPTTLWPRNEGLSTFYFPDGQGIWPRPHRWQSGEWKCIHYI